MVNTRKILIKTVCLAFIPAKVAIYQSKHFSGYSGFLTRAQTIFPFQTIKFEVYFSFAALCNVFIHFYLFDFLKRHSTFCQDY